MDIFILNKNKEIIDVLSNNGVNPTSPFYNEEYIQYLATGADTFSFSTVSNSRTNKSVEKGNYALFKYMNKFKMFQIMYTETEHKEYKEKSCYCETLGLELINQVIRVLSLDGDVTAFFNAILQDSTFKLGYVDPSVTEVKSISINKPTAIYKVIQDNLETYNIEIEFRVDIKNNKVVGQYIDVYRKRGRITNNRFEYGENVNRVKKKEDLSDFCSALIGYGQNGIDFRNVEWSIANGNPVDKPLNQDFVADKEAHAFFNNNGNYIFGVYESDAENAADLLNETYKELQKRKLPKLEYEIDISLIDEDIQIGDTVYVIDNEYDPPIYLEARVTELTKCFTDETKNKCTLANFKEIKSNIKSLSKSDIMLDVIDYITQIKAGILTETDIKMLRDYLEKMNIEKSEIDALFEKYKPSIDEEQPTYFISNLEGSIININLENNINYKCSTLEELALNVIDQSNDFSSIIEFKTGYDCYPMRFKKNDNIYMTGDDTKNGVLINKADTTYKIVVSYNTDATINATYKAIVSVIEKGTGTYKIHEGFSKGEQLIELALQYYDNRTLFKYNQLTPLNYYVSGLKPAKYVSKWKTDDLYHIDCSTFTNQLFRARGYLNSIYKNLDYGMGASKKYGWGFNIGRTAAEQAKWCIENGYQLDISTSNEEDWWNLKEGDLVFWETRTGDGESNNDRYMAVAHVAVIRTPKTSSNTTTTLEVSTVNGVVLNRSLQNNYPEKILFFARVRR